MAKLTANRSNIIKFLNSLESIPEMPEIEILNYEPGPSGIILYYSKINKQKAVKFQKALANYMKEKFTGLYSISGSPGKPVPGVKTTESIGVRVIFKNSGEGGSIKRGAIPTLIQEEGSVIIFNRALVDGVKFTDEDSILGDAETKRQLEKCFKKKGDWTSRLEDWTWTYYQQQKQFLTKYQNSKWSPFVYGKDKQDFVSFFSDLIKKAKNLGGNVSKYDQWNPSDIWAAYDMNKIKKEIEKDLGKEPNLIQLSELNSKLVKMFQEGRLVGISLKKVLYGSEANIVLRNIDGPSKVIGDIDSLKLVKFEIGNIFSGETVTTYIKLGKTNEYSINVNSSSKTSGSNLTFNTHVKKTPAAQGGQAPVKDVEQLLNKGSKPITFVNNWRNYPKSKEEYMDDKRDWEKMYKVVSETFKGTTPSYDEWENFIFGLFDKSPFIAISKIMHLNFYYDGLNNFGTDPEFWTDLLHLGLKVGDKFAPHAKIS